jgi:hypothetical protein
MKKISLLLLFILIFSGCKNSEKDNYNASLDFYGNASKNEHPGKKLMEMYCYACHDAKTPEDKRLAPPMIAVKTRYVFNNTTKDEFINDVQNWIKNPNEKDARMFGAVRRFGVMTKLPYPEKDVQLIADYIFDNKIEEPEWFQEHRNQNMGKGRRGMH